MDRLEAGRILERLASHWPAMASTDSVADDWFRAIRSTPLATATSAADTLVTGWTRDRAPRIADWQETCRSVAQRRALEATMVPELESPKIDPSRASELIREMREEIKLRRWKPARREEA